MNSYVEVVWNLWKGFCGEDWKFMTTLFVIMYIIGILGVIVIK